MHRRAPRYRALGASRTAENDRYERALGSNARPLPRVAGSQQLDRSSCAVDHHSRAAWERAKVKAAHTRNGGRRHDRREHVRDRRSVDGDQEHQSRPLPARQRCLRGSVKGPTTGSSPVRASRQAGIGARRRQCRLPGSGGSVLSGSRCWLRRRELEGTGPGQTGEGGNESSGRDVVLVNGAAENVTAGDPAGRGRPQ